MSRASWEDTIEMIRVCAIRQHEAAREFNLGNTGSRGYEMSDTPLVADPSDCGVEGNVVLPATEWNG